MRKNTAIKKNEWNKDLSRFMDVLLAKGVKLKRAAEVGRRTVEYFRGCDFIEYLMNEREHLLEKHQTAFDGYKLLNNKGCEEFGEYLLQNGFIYRADYKPIEGAPDASESGKARRTPKWPKRLEYSSRQRFDESGFYVVVYEGSKSLHYAALVLMIIIVLLLCMFPAWPFKVKVGVWYIGVSLMALMLLLVVGRLVLFSLLWFFGVDFWIFPNLFNEDAGVIATFIPFYAFTKRNDNWLMVLARGMSVVLLAATIHQLGKTHSVSDVGAFAKRSFLDVLEWGNRKLAEGPGSGGRDKIEKLGGAASFNESMDMMDNDDSIFEGGEAAAILHTDPMLEEEIKAMDEDENCTKGCGYDSFEALIDECSSNCECMKKLFASNCLSKCSNIIQLELKEAELEACAEEDEKLTAAS